MDNTAARDLSYSPELTTRAPPPNTLRDATSSFENVWSLSSWSWLVPFVRSCDNLANFFTKPLPAKSFLAFRDRDHLFLLHDRHLFLDFHSLLYTLHASCSKLH